MKIRDLKYIFGYTKIEKVDNKLLRGSAIFTPVKCARLKMAGVNQVIDLREGVKKESTFAQFLERQYCKLFNIKYVNMGVLFKHDFVPSKDYFDKINSAIVNNKGKSFIHCHYGKHRTGECLAMYQKSQNIDENIIIDNLIKCGWNKKSDYREESYNSLILFLNKYFPNLEYLKKVERYRAKIFG